MISLAPPAALVPPQEVQSLQELSMRACRTHYPDQVFFRGIPYMPVRTPNSTLVDHLAPGVLNGVYEVTATTAIVPVTSQPRVSACKFALVNVAAAGITMPVAASTGYVIATQISLTGTASCFAGCTVGGVAGVAFYTSAFLVLARATNLCRFI